MFMYRTQSSRSPILRVWTACLAVLIICMAAASPFEVSAQEASLPAPTWTAAQSGDICIPGGKGILPVASPAVSARGAVLLEAESGAVVFAQNKDARLPMASTTKIMTALVALEILPLDTPVKITAESVGVEGSSIYLVEGEILSLEHLLYALLLESANDAAVAIAVAVAGSVEEFAVLMNAKAEELGLTNTHFVNPHGLDDPEHYTTAYELALIAREALADPTFREICSTRRKTIPLHGDEGVRLLINHNKLLQAYEGCIGVKTGFTKKTGRCLVSAAEREGVTLIAVTLNAPDDWRDHTAMLDYGFGRYQALFLGGEEFFTAPLWVISGNRDYTMVECRDTLTVTLRRDHGPIICVVELPRFEFAPIQNSQIVGRLCFYEERPNRERHVLGEIPLYAAYAVEETAPPMTLWERIWELFA